MCTKIGVDAGMNQACRTNVRHHTPVHAPGTRPDLNASVKVGKRNNGGAMNATLTVSPLTRADRCDRCGMFHAEFEVLSVHWCSFLVHWKKATRVSTKTTKGPILFGPFTAEGSDSSCYQMSFKPSWIERFAPVPRTGLGDA